MNIRKYTKKKFDRLVDKFKLMESKKTMFFDCYGWHLYTYMLKSSCIRKLYKKNRKYPETQFIAFKWRK